MLEASLIQNVIRVFNILSLHYIGTHFLNKYVKKLAIVINIFRITLTLTSSHCTLCLIDFYVQFLQLEFKKEPSLGGSTDSHDCMQIFIDIVDFIHSQYACLLSNLSGFALLSIIRGSLSSLVQRIQLHSCFRHSILAADFVRIRRNMSKQFLHIRCKQCLAQVDIFKMLIESFFHLMWEEKLDPFCYSINHETF